MVEDAQVAGRAHDDQAPDRRPARRGAQRVESAEGEPHRGNTAPGRRQRARRRVGLPPFLPPPGEPAGRIAVAADVDREHVVIGRERFRDATDLGKGPRSEQAVHDQHAGASRALPGGRRERHAPFVVQEDVSRRRDHACSGSPRTGAPFDAVSGGLL